MLQIVRPSAYSSVMTDTPRTPLPGSDRTAARDAAGARPIDPNDQIELTVVLRRRTDGELGAVPGDLAAVTAALQQAGLEIVASDEPSRRIRVRGPASTVTSTFDTELELVTSTAPDGRAVTHRQRTGELALPADLGDRVIAVLGIDDRPQARSQFRIAAPSATATSYTPLQLGEKYDFPPDTDGTGQAVAIIELGGGFAQSDLDTYFGQLGITGPTVSSVSVDGAQNEPGADPQRRRRRGAARRRGHRRPGTRRGNQRLLRTEQ